MFVVLGLTGKCAQHEFSHECSTYFLTVKVSFAASWVILMYATPTIQQRVKIVPNSPPFLLLKVALVAAIYSGTCVVHIASALGIMPDDTV